MSLVQTNEEYKLAFQQAKQLAEKLNNWINLKAEIKRFEDAYSVASDKLYNLESMLTAQTSKSVFTTQDYASARSIYLATKEATVAAGNRKGPGGDNLRDARRKLEMLAQTYSVLMAQYSAVPIDTGYGGGDGDEPGKGEEPNSQNGGENDGTQGGIEESTSPNFTVIVLFVVLAAAVAMVLRKIIKK